MWVSNFQAEDTPQIKEALEITNFVLGTEIGNHMLLDQLEKLSSIDLLTGLYNRNRLNNDMNEILASPDALTSLIFLDINGLKKVNDLEGHIAGDILIKRAANTLISVFHNNDIYRVGGDEFVALFLNGNFDSKEEYFKAFNKRIDENVKNKDRVIISSGMAEYDPEKDCSILTIFTRADRDMYARKQKLKETQEELQKE